MYSFEDFKGIIARLRAPDGCPWDREQTHGSLRDCMIEEAYEVVDGIDRYEKTGSFENLREELGDVLLQVMMHSQIGEEEGIFTIEDVIHEISEKMVRRHPHVFGEAEAKTSSQVLKNWDEIKKQEKGESSVSESLISVARALPANIRAQKVQKKAGKAGFDFQNMEEVLSKVTEELSETMEAWESGDRKQIEEEYGDFLFSAVNLSRFLGVNAENSLTNATDKFISRFKSVEAAASLKGRSVSEMDIDELNELWENAKR
ncbi:nucleoside triphosphate pyrophosphohydrolase [Anaerolentibacter hominis]|uniref:nucleoside triphosphate pyrophosphohydrolase n=1 Tax=Anaerolentibacter hominis TaxID=3079009 RepID=UPI0031B8A380